MPFKSWGTVVPFTQKRGINFTEQVPTGKTIGIYGYQPAPAAISPPHYATLQAFDLNTLANALNSIGKGTVNYLQLSWNEQGSVITHITISDLALGIVFSNTQNIDGVQEILNMALSSSLGSVLTALYMNQLNAWKAYRLNEAPENNWLLIAGITGGLIAVATVIYLVRRRR